MILQIENLTGGYTQGHDILQGVDLEVNEGDSIGIIGLNGSGKTTLAKAIMNILPYRQGRIFFNGIDISKKSTQELSSLGIAMFMQGGRVFDELSVWENLSFAANSKKDLEEIEKFSPPLHFENKKLFTMRADKLSGGERHTLALLMCMLRKPELLILDEPSAGLSPVAVSEMYQALDLFRKKKHLTIVLIEQNVAKAIEFCSSVNLLRNGKFTNTFTNKNISEIENVLFSKNLSAPNFQVNKKNHNRIAKP
jgi:ABC-type branched-subunit amino acid transport system ATPase component